MEPSDLYKQYKSEFIQNCSLLESQPPEQNPSQYERLINENNLLLKHISIQLCSFGPKFTETENSILKPYKNKYLKRKRQWESERKGLFQNSSFSRPSELQQNEKLSECKQLLYGMEDSSNSISETLNSQSERLKNTKKSVTKVQEVMNQASKLADKMINREQRRQYMTYFVLVMVIIIIGLFKVYYF